MWHLWESYGVALLGGALIGLASAGLLLTSGRIAGVSGILAGALRPRAEAADWPWRTAFVLGLVGSGLGMALLQPALLSSTMTASGPWLLGAGLLAGFGARISGGCTSGHGICGIGTGSRRSLLATMTFMLSGALAVFLVRALGGL